MRRLATVRVRVTCAAVVVVAVALAVAGAWLVRAHRASLTSDIESTAHQRAADVASTVGDGQLARTLGAPRGDEKYVQVVDGNGTVVAASPNVGVGVRISQLVPGADGWAARTVDHLPAGDAPFRVVARRVDTKATTYTVYVAQSLEPVARSSDELIRLLLLGLPVVLVVIGLTTWFVIGRALRPVAAIRTKVESIGASQDLTQRVPEPTRDEIGRLAHTMNGMLARLQLASGQQRRFVDDASHELRNPLTSIRSEIEIGLAHPDDTDWVATANSVLDDTIRMQRLTDDLLALARADVEAGATEHDTAVDLDEIVLSEARRLRERTRHRVDTSAVSGAQLCGDAEDLARAVRNLFENADRHAASTITVALHEGDCDVTLTVADDGPGIPEAQRDRVFERFTRLDDARARDSGGTGLGLAITHDIVTSHGGTITVMSCTGMSETGARFAATFPLRHGRLET